VTSTTYNDSVETHLAPENPKDHLLLAFYSNATVRSTEEVI
jgi:hypothetical protein